MSTDTVAHFVGLDYHKDDIQVCILDLAGAILVNRKIPNDEILLDAFVHKHVKNSPFKAAIEASCGSADLADNMIHRYHWNIRQSHAGLVSRMRQSPDKSDYSDAQILADLIRVDYLPEVWLPPKKIRHLQTVVK